MNRLIFSIIVAIGITVGNVSIAMSQNQVIEDSPFGIFGVFALEYGNFMSNMNFDNEDYFAWAGKHFQDLGAKMSRINTLLIWNKVEPNPGKGYVWEGENILKTDSILKSAFKYGGNDFGMVMVIEPSRHRKINIDDGNKVYLKNFIKTAVERYNGDGINDFDTNIKVKYWQASNEPFLFDEWFKQGGTIESYADFVSLMSEAVKSVDPKAKIVLGAETAIRDQKLLSDNMKLVIAALNQKKVFDVVDIHFWGTAGRYKMEIAREMRLYLDKLGYTNVEIWSMENGTYINDPGGPLPLQTEKEQAISLIKRYVYNLAHDVDRIFWNNLVEWDCFAGRCGGQFDNMGLISDGKNSGETLDTLGVPRLSYYSYKIMTEKLEGSDWDNIQRIHEKEGIYIYKFTNDSKPVWVAWSDDLQKKEIIISGIISSQVKITEAVSIYKSGKDITDYNKAFKTEIKNVNNNKVTISLEESPVFVEE